VFFGHVTEGSKLSVWEAITSRKSVRSFADEPLDEEQLRRCLEAARLAPSWANKQCWHFVVIQGKEAVDELGIVPANIKNAPALIVACGDPEKSGNLDGKPYYLVDVAIAVEHIVLAAWEQGLGTVWVGALKEDKVRKALGIPENIKVVAMIPIGYPADKEGVRQKLIRKAVGSDNRKELKEIVHWGKW
jgi:nitroreductase